MQLGYQIFSSPLGEVLVAGTQLVITHVMLGTDKSQLGAEFMIQHESVSSFGKTEYVKDACAAIALYLGGESQSIDVAILVEGTDFERKVWQAIRQIPYGKTQDCDAIAEAVGEPGALDAVALVCAKNPVPLIIPCHRVMYAGSNTGSYVWGADAQRFLLDMEKALTKTLSAA